MADIKIVNCHTHTFTSKHIPRDYPLKFLWLFKRIPGLVRLMAGICSVIGQQPLAEKLRRLYRFQKESQVQGQEVILQGLRRFYPPNTRFVILPMDMADIGFGPIESSLKVQHDELAQLAKDPEIGPSVIPFATINPNNDPKAAELWRAIDDLEFKGVKIYSRLGFAPDHPVLMQHLYPKMEKRNLPLMTHCSRGGVQGKYVSDTDANLFTDPAAYIPIMKKHPKLKICLAHFGGQYDWDMYVNEGSPAGDEMQNWQIAIRRMIGSGDYPELWTDISYTLFHFDDYIPFLRMFLTGDDLASKRLRRRTLFGSDYYMTRQEKLSERAVCFRLRNALGEETFRQIAEKNPQIWLGEEKDTPMPKG